MAPTLDNPTDRLIGRWEVATGPWLPLVDRTLFRWRLTKSTSPIMVDSPLIALTIAGLTSALKGL